MKKIKILLFKGMFLVILAGAASTVTLAQSNDDFNPGHPDRYVVQEGDTLWDIANRFLKDPWRWPHIWQENPDIENPHLIYPGDLLVVTSDRRIKAVRLEPQVHRQPLIRAIPTIPPNVIQPFLDGSMIVDPGELDNVGHVVSGVNDELVIGKYTQFYARGLEDISAEEYRVFRVGRELYDPETGELLGIEGIHLGDARMLRADEDTSKLQVISSNQEIEPTDLLLPIELRTPLPYFQPHAPEERIEGWILYAPGGVQEIGLYDVVIISGGSDQGLEQGHVVEALLHRGESVDPVTGEIFEIPEEISGLMMVFRVFNKLSYALILEANRAISVGDRYATP